MDKEFYMLSAFAYPSNANLHLGHAFAYGIMNMYCNHLRYKGIKVFQPFGYDTHGVGTLKYAERVKRDVYEVANENIRNFQKQMKKLNLNYEDLLSTHDESYIKWTQWIFEKLYENGLAYEKYDDINWCQECQNILADEQVIDNKCEKCGNIITLKKENQWYIKTTDYKQRLIDNLSNLNYPEHTKKAQINFLKNLRDWSVGRTQTFGTPIPNSIINNTNNKTLCTMFDSSWYYIRYCDPYNENEICSKEKYKPVDLYCCGSELTTNHLIYARFINMFLYDIGVISCEEPFIRVIHNGKILAPDGSKMSKSKGNAINPDDYDSDTLLFYLAFQSHFFDDCKWSDQNIAGIKRFINRFKEWMSREGNDTIDVESFKKKIFGYSQSFKFNKVVSEFMTLVNQNRTKNLTPQIKEELIGILEIYMPSIREKVES
jgi:leucyl-tRNA synthetase